MLHPNVLALSLLLPSLGLAREPQAVEPEFGTRAVEHGARLAPSEEIRVPTVFEGFVLEPDGAPAEGAVVVSSAGGKAVTDHTGIYRLEVGVPLEAQSLQLTAVGPGARSLVASASVPLAWTSARQRVDPLQLSSTSCAPHWLPTFGGEPGTNGLVQALVVFDDGSGAALYAGGSFTTAGACPADYIARWDGSSWSTLGSGMDDEVQTLSVFDDGSGPALYAGGRFTTAGGVAANHIARWNGSSWSPLGSGVDGVVRALAVFDDGSGPALHVGGAFTSAGAIVGNSVARWEGASWSSLGTGMNNDVRCLAVFDDGNGPALYAGGSFTTAGESAASRIAKWNGTSWSNLGTGVNSQVRSLAIFDDGSGPALYAGGNFTTAGGGAAGRIAKWDGASWSALGGGLNRSVLALAVFDDGSGRALYAGGDFTAADGASANYIARWNGSSWSALDSGMNAEVRALAAFHDGNERALFSGGLFTPAVEIPARWMAKWNGSNWSVVGDGLDNAVKALAVFDDGSGPALHAGGIFTTAGNTTTRYVARWDGSSWSALGSGFAGGQSTQVSALAVFDDGGGPALYAGGQFTTAGGVAANCLARWDGSSWSPIGTGFTHNLGIPLVHALIVFDDGSGPALYAGGNFHSVDGVPALRLARWNGSSWSGGAMNDIVRALAIFDDGNGPALYVGGDFTDVGGVAANGIARWDGSSWSALGTGVTNFASTASVYALKAFDDGSGPGLYVGGLFKTAGGMPVGNIARWDGQSWFGMNSWDSFVFALEVFDDGSGPALYAGGADQSLDGGRRIARWNGSGWSTLGSGVGSILQGGGSVHALVVFDDGSGPALLAGGAFGCVPDSGDSFLARWGQGPQPVLSCPTEIYVKDRGTPGEFVTFSVSASDCWDPAPTVVCVPPSGSFFPRGTTLVTCTATDTFGNQATCQFPVTVRIKVTRPRPSGAPTPR